MERFPDKNILYLDVDLQIVDYPKDLVNVSDEQYDFAIYNWLNDEHNEAYVPISKKHQVENSHSHLYVFSHRVDYRSKTQLICSGGVQFYKNSDSAKRLLKEWQYVMAEAPYSADDECLDLAYNNFKATDLKSFWLDKSYIRLPWWPHVKPVILHPEWTRAYARPPLPEYPNRRHFYPERCELRSTPYYFPPDCIIDTKNSLLRKMENSQLVNIRKIGQRFWIYSE